MTAVDSDYNVDINWNRQGFSLDELDSIEKQAELFENCQSKYNVDAFDFIEKYMLSGEASESGSFDLVNLNQSEKVTVGLGS